jgi:rubrerythrin
MLDLLRDRGVPVHRQHFTWTELAQPPISKLDADAFTRVRVIAMIALEAEAVQFGHAVARLYPRLHEHLAVIRRIEHHQHTLIAGLLPPDHTPLETTIAVEQAEIELTASIARDEPDPEVMKVYRFGLLEDVDHLYRFAALMDRLWGQDANTILQSQTDIAPGRPTALEHRHPLDDLRHSYDRERADLLTRLHALTLTALQQHARDYYTHVGPAFADPLARRLFAEIASTEEQHVTQYESVIDPREGILEKWLLHEAAEAFNYWSCAEQESDPRVRSIWERMLDYELGHVRVVAELFEDIEHRDAREVLDRALEVPLEHRSQRDLVRTVLRAEIGLSAREQELVPRADEAGRTRGERARLDRDDSPSNVIAAGYVWAPGTELASAHPHERVPHRQRLSPLARSEQ